MRISVLAIIAVLLTACGQAHQITTREDYLAEATRTYQGIDREQIIKAAEIVLKHSDPGDWDFRYKADGFVGLRRYFIYAVIAAAAGRERWEFTARYNDAGNIHAGVSVSEAGNTSNSYGSQAYEAGMNAVELYRLFWSRVDYVLGRRADWPDCDRAEKAIKAKGGNPSSLAGLCGLTSQGRKSPPPQRPITGI